MYATWLCLALYHASPTAAHLGSREDSSMNDQLVGWQGGIGRRSTWNIISNCLSTIIACTWSVQHLNIPSPADTLWKRWWRSFKWMIITILFPELIIIHAIFEVQMAWQAFQLMRRNGKNVELPWWMRRPSWRNPPGKARTHDRKWTLTHCFYGNMGGFCYGEAPEGQFPVTAQQLAAEAGFEDPVVTKEEIQDKSKRDWFSKTVAALEFLQLALSLIVRTNRGLAFSQLETLTLGLAICGAVIYLLLFYKPQNLATNTPLGQNPPLRFKRTYDSFWKVLVNEPSNSAPRKRASSEHTSSLHNEIPEGIPDRIPNDNFPIFDGRITHPGVFLLALASGLFGALHAIAWNSEFPSHVEKILWQTATVVAAGSPVLGLLTVPFAQWTISAGDSESFRINCVALMREYFYQLETTQDKDPILRAMSKLEGATANPQARQSYAGIFSVEDGRSELMSNLREFLRKPLLRHLASLLRLKDNKYSQIRLASETDQRDNRDLKDGIHSRVGEQSRRKLKNAMCSRSSSKICISF